MTDNKRKCTRCMVTLPIDKFKIKRSGEIYKRCIDCGLKDKEARDKSKCEHGKRKERCKDCHGGGISA